ncbi:MAG: VPDSG-CTERM sorting domain-containing protein [Verrucomicrobiota bacterium]
MKKALLAGLLIGSLNFAQATSITLTSGSTLHGANAYEYLVSLTAGQNITAATLTFNNVKLTASGWNTFSYDLINRQDATTAISADADTQGDYFTSHSPYSSTAVQLGTKTFRLGETWNSTYTFSGATLSTLNTYAADGFFNFGFDPDCTYSVGSIVFNYTAQTVTNHTSVPDSATTVMLLGASLVSLVALRRKFCII